MQSGFTGGGPPDFYTSGRSMANPSHPNPYRSQLSGGAFVDPTIPQIARQIPSSLLGKRNLSDLHSLNQYTHHNLPVNNLFLRSVKPRAGFSHPISPLSNFDLYSTMSLPSSEVQTHRLYGSSSAAVLQQLRQQPNSSAVTLRDLQNLDSEKKKMMNHRLQELEKQLLEDNDDDDGSDAASVITSSTSAWCETMYNLISPTAPPNQKPVSTSPTTSASSSCSSSTSSSVASPSSDSWKQSVIEAAAAISEGKLDVVDEILAPVVKISNARGSSVQRLAEYMVFALKSRVNPAEFPPPVAEIFGDEHSAATQSLYDVSPCFKLAFMAANLAILEAIEEEDRKLHIVDFDIGKGGQYMNLIHLLSGRQKGKVVVKLTAVVAENGRDERLKHVGESLSQLAKELGVGFKFNMVKQEPSELTRESLGCDADESLAVNFAFKLYQMPDESVSTENPRDELLRRVKALAPAVVTVMEQELNTNTAPFAARVSESCIYYGSLFDSIDSTVWCDHPDRVKVEEGLGRKLANSLACEGRERVERCEVSGKWRARMGMAGFESRRMSEMVAESMKTRLSSGYRVNPGFTVKEENGGICFGWMGRTLTVTTAWR
ncbi:scarecrow-like protein 8 [Cucurbita moschata]|uniref:Scarecrow-like protein 8 n=1 Tax=Cucurbita moschata TaxID=3662 RepID=A0A6J1H2B4_CUCMO|nr:scarecrow-like protein 8 [Cucurbita moschata]